MLGAAKLAIRDNTPTYRLYYNYSQDFEGPDGGSRGGGFRIMTRNVPAGTVLYWNIVGVTGNITASDFNPASLTGSTTLTFNNQNVYPFQNDGDVTLLSLGYVGDQITEGDESFYIQLRTGSNAGPVVATSNTITLVDLSVGTPTYAVSPAANNVDEGSSLQFNVSTTSVNNGTTLYWTITNAGDFGTSSGSFQINSNAGSFSVTPTADTTTEGAETFTASIRTGSTSGTVVATSSSVTINDTSTAPASYTDANAQYLRLALPFNSTTGLDDISHLFTNAVNTSATPRSGPTNNAVSITTSESKYYSSSAVGQRTGVALTFTLPVNIVIGSDFCIEFWAKTTFTTNTNNWVWGDGYSSRELALGIYSNGTLPTSLTVWNGNGRIGGVGTGWNHFAFNNGNWYYNGARRGTPSYGTAGWSFNSLRVFQQESGDPNNFVGWMNDFRVYIGTNKYSSNFTPPTQMIP